LLLNGVTACWSDRVGVDRDGVKNYRDQRVWLGEQLTVRTQPHNSTVDETAHKVKWKYVKSRGEIALKVGEWGRNLLASLAVFKFDDNDVLTLPLTDKVRSLVAEAMVRSIGRQPYLTPLLDKSELWTGFGDGVLEKGRWANPPLIRGHHPSIESAACERIATRQMQPVLDAINSLQSVPFAINEPVFKFMVPARGVEVARTAATA
jgi:hypothetical protein